jgi:hypothetical protein
VDIKEFKRVTESKVSNEKMEINMKKMQKIHEHLTNVAMMLVETSKSMIPKQTSSSIKAEETANTQLAKREYLLRQT